MFPRYFEKKELFVSDSEQLTSTTERFTLAGCWIDQENKNNGMLRTKRSILFLRKDILQSAKLTDFVWIIMLLVLNKTIFRSAEMDTLGEVWY
jgi:ethanolamine utilization cobalamin adenosyltransferase